MLCLRAQAVKLAHESHQGLVKIKRLIQEKVWFYLIDSYVEECIKMPNLPVSRELTQSTILTGRRRRFHRK